MDLSLDQTENLWSSSRPSQIVLQRFWISVAIIYAKYEAMYQERPQGISQEASQCSLKYDVGDILD